MGRGDDSDEERHDRFRSERNATAAKPISSSGSRRSPIHSSDSYSKYSSQHRRRDVRRSRDRSKDRLRKERERSREKESSKRRSSVERDRKEKRRRSTSREKWRRRSEEKRSSNSHSDGQRSESRHRADDYKPRTSDSGSTKRRSSRDRSDNHSSRAEVDTFVERFERRRRSTEEVEEEVVDNTVIYRDPTPSPERDQSSKSPSSSSNNVSSSSSAKKKRNGDKKHKKDKKKRKKEKSSLSTNSGSSWIGTKEENDDPNQCFGPVLPPGTELRNDDNEDICSRPPSACSSVGNPNEIKCSLTSKGDDVFENKESPLKRNDLIINNNGSSNPGTPDYSSLEEGEVKSPSRKSIKVYGPQLPGAVADAVVSSSYGPVLPPCHHPVPDKTQQGVTHESDGGSSDGGIGPLPIGQSSQVTSALDARAAYIKSQMENKDGESNNGAAKREEWMMELPEGRAVDMKLGAPRKFRAREGPDMSDRSSWTDTPNEKARKKEMADLGIEEFSPEKESQEMKRLVIMERDKDMERRAKEGGKKRDKSLLEIHQKELKRKKKKEEKSRGGTKEERRPFSREVDLQSNVFSDSVKSSLIKKAQLLNSRFSAGESKYL